MAIEAYLDAFDPDYVVKVGALESRAMDFGHREIIDCSKILKTVESENAPACGIGLFEVLQYFYDKELKFVRQHPLKFSLPKYNPKSQIFFASIFGSLPQPINKVLLENLEGLPGFENRDCSLENYAEFLEPDNLFITRIGSIDIKSIKKSPRRGDCIVFLDANSTLDVLD